MADLKNPREFTVSDILVTFVHHYKIMVLIPVVVTAIAAGFVFSLKPEYEARGNLEVGRVLEKPLEEPVAVADRMRTRPFLAKAARKLGWKDTSLELRERITVDVIYRQPASQEEPTRSLAVTATANDPRKARDLVDAMLTTVVDEHRALFDQSFDANDRLAKDIQADMAQSRAEVDQGYAQLNQLTASGQASPLDVVYISSYLREKEDHVLRLQEIALEFQQMLYSGVFTKPTMITVAPEIPDAPSGPHRIRVVALAFGIAFIVAAVLAFFFERFGRNKKTDDGDAGAAREKDKKKPAGSRR